MKIKKIITLLGDIIGLYAALIISLFIRYKEINLDVFRVHLPYFSIIFLLWLIVFYIYNLYDLDISADRSKFFANLVKIMVVNILISIVFFYLAPDLFLITITPKVILLLNILVSTILVCIWHYLIHLLWDALKLKTNIAILGYSPEAVKLAEEIVKKPHLGYNLKLVIKEGGPSPQLNNVEIKHDFKNIEKDFTDNKIQIAILSPEIYRSTDLIQSLFECIKYKIEFLSISDFYERFTKRILIQVINRFWFLENISQKQRGKTVYDFFKRVFDFILVLLLLILSFPLWVIIILLIAITSKGPIFYTQIRLGYGGKPFKVVKFRSTDINTSKTTKFGKFLQKTRLDELPQLINIMKGKMSFVGPMAEKLELHDELETHIPFFRERYLVKPGITGWAQIRYGYTQSIEDNVERIQYDLYYVKNRSFVLDLEILLKTIDTVLRGGGR